MLSSIDNLNQIIGPGKISWQGSKGFGIIGKTQDWDEAYLIDYRNKTDYNDAIIRFKESIFEKIQYYPLYHFQISKYQL